MSHTVVQDDIFLNYNVHGCYGLSIIHHAVAVSTTITILVQQMCINPRLKIVPSKCTEFTPV